MKGPLVSGDGGTGLRKAGLQSQQGGTRASAGHRSHLRTFATRITYLAAPPTLAAAVVLSRYIEAGSLLVTALRAVAVAVALGTAIALVLLPVVGLRRTALWGCLIVLVLAEAISPVVLAAATGIWIGSLDMQRSGNRSVQRILTFIEGAAPFFATLLLAAVIGSGVANGSIGLPTNWPPPTVKTVGSGGPDIFVILLDGYPGPDTLRERFDYDEGPFFAALADRGFDVPAHNRSNYTETGNTLTSMLHMRYLFDIAALEHAPTGGAAAYRALSEVLSAPLPAFDLLRRRGYETITIPSLTDTYRIGSADRVIDTADPNAFELLVLGRSVFGPIIDWAAPDLLLDQQRARSLAAINANVLLAREEGPPRLVITHLLMPHAPFVFGPDGEEVPPLECFPSDCTIYEAPPTKAEHLQRYLDQVKFVNRKMLEMIDAMRANRTEPPVIVLFSDHGSRAFPEDTDERFHNFFASATPGHVGLFPDDITLVNMFPILAGAYFDERVSLQPSLFFLTRNGAEPLLLEPVENP